jgi:formamidopyrimidine-DNA glycosylase
MPEIIEVKKYCDFIKKYVKNINIIEINILNGRYKKHGAFELYNKIKKALPLKVIDVNTKGKFTYITFENNFYMFVTLGLSGGWMYKEKNSNKDDYKFLSMYKYMNKNSPYYKNAINHINVEFKTKNGSLYFYDMLSFGTIKIVIDYNLVIQKLNKIAHDVMDETTTFDIFKEQIKKNKNLNKHIGIVLLDQKTISGVGNYLRSDVLWLSRISPFRLVKNINDKELFLIYKSIKSLVWNSYNNNKGIKLGYITKKDKFPNHYKRNFFVYKNDDDIYGNKVIKDELFEGTQKRFIYWTKIQK